MDEVNLRKSLSEGFPIHGRHVSKLEQLVQQNPDDRESRFQLILYYELNLSEIRKKLDKYFAHVLWFIENDPENKIHTSGTAVTIFAEKGPQYVKVLKEAWYRQVRKHPNSAIVIAHAAWFCASSVNLLRVSALLWRKALLLEPDNYKSLEGLCLAYSWLAFAGSERRQRYYTLKAAQVGLNAIAKDRTAFVGSELGELMFDQLEKLTQSHNFKNEHKMLFQLRYANET